MRLKPFVILLGIILVSGSCRKNGTSNSGGGSDANVQGNWAGVLSDSRGTNSATFAMAQSKSSVTGTYAYGTTSGTFAATVSGNTLSFNLTKTSSCAGSYGGQMNVVTPSTMTVTYSGTDCAGIITGGNGLLIKQ